ncbi:delta adaptin, partial [Reticulomyxa filosa]
KKKKKNLFSLIPILIYFVLFYLGLLGLNKVMPQNPRAVAESRDLILQCLDDPDVTIRMRALDLIMSMVTEKNLEAIIQRLTDHLYGTDGSYRDHVLEQIIKVCSKEDYEFVRDFAWYVQLLTNMTNLQSMSRRNAELIAENMIDVTLRVPEVRKFAAQQMEILIVNNGLIGDAHNMQSNAICRVLRAAAYIVGEFAELVKDHLTLVKAMLQTRVASLPGDIQGLFVHNALKVLGYGLVKILNDDNEQQATNQPDKSQVCKDLITGSIQLLEPLAGSQHIEVQERATAYIYFLKWLQPALETAAKSERKETAAAFVQVFSSELAPVHAKNQAIAAKKIPAGLSLDDWMGEPWPESEKEDE